LNTWHNVAFCSAKPLIFTALGFFSLSLAFILLLLVIIVCINGLNLITVLYSQFLLLYSPVSFIDFYFIIFFILAVVIS